MSKKIMLIAGEASGDLLAAELVEALRDHPFARALSVPPRFVGAGGPRMADAGVEIVADMTSYAVVGLWEVLLQYHRFRSLFRTLLDRAIVEQPDAIVFVDFAGFNRRLAAAIRREIRSFENRPFHKWRPKLIYYVSPQVWASRPGRARQLERDMDLLLSILPFEKSWYARRTPNLRVEYVGHPLLDRYASPSGNPAKRSEPATEPRWLLLPGSRLSELNRHVPVMLEAVVIARRRGPVSVRIAVPSTVLAQHIRDGWGIRISDLDIQIEAGGLPALMRSSDVAIASTGTVTLECAYFGLPAVAMYRTSWLTYQVGRRLIRVPHLAMPNLLAGKVVMPEFIQRDADAGRIAEAAWELVESPERRERALRDLDEVTAQLGEKGASLRAANWIWEMFRDPNTQTIAQEHTRNAPKCR